MSEKELARIRERQGADGSPRIYRVLRFRYSGRPRAVRGMSNLTLAEVQAHCSREDTSSRSTGQFAWFDGYDYMPGCRPKEAR